MQPTEEEREVLKSLERDVARLARAEGVNPQQLWAKFVDGCGKSGYYGDHDKGFRALRQLARSMK